MKTRYIFFSLLAGISLMACTSSNTKTQQEVGVMDTLLLRDYRPVNVNNIPVTYVEKAKYPVIDMHSHD